MNENTNKTQRQIEIISEAKTKAIDVIWSEFLKDCKFVAERRNSEQLSDDLDLFFAEFTSTWNDYKPLIVARRD